MEFEDIFDKVLIYGAKSIALGVCCAMEILFPEKEILGFLVSQKEGNPDKLGGFPVFEIADYWKRRMDKGSGNEKITVLIGTPETVHDEIIQMLEQYGFTSYVCIRWELEEKLMEQYFARIGKFPSLHRMNDSYEKRETIQGRFQVFVVNSCIDRGLQKRRDERAADKEWLHGLQAGAGLASMRTAEYADNTGKNISIKNGNYCELSALYWIWQNVLEADGKADGYYGMFQYRRLLDIEEEDIRQILENDVDVVLPFPTVHEPDIREHHGRYIKEKDWEAMLRALGELQPEYAEAFKSLSRQPYLYNYNILVAKKAVLRDYCAWLFPILERTEELSNPKGWEREDRYIGYLGESLLTLYFMYHGDRLRIVHTGRVMLV